MNDFELLQHEEFGFVRYKTDDEGKPWYVVGDLLSALRFKNDRDAVIACVSEEDAQVFKVLSGCCVRRFWLVNKNGLAGLVAKSKSKNAQQYGEWLTNAIHAQEPQKKKDTVTVAVNDVEITIKTK